MKETLEEHAKRTEKTIIPGIDETLDEYAQRMKEQRGKAKVGCREECKVKTLKSGKEVECGRMCSIEEEHEISECKCKMHVDTVNLVCQRVAASEMKREEEQRRERKQPLKLVENKDVDEEASRKTRRVVLEKRSTPSSSSKARPEERSKSISKTKTKKTVLKLTLHNHSTLKKKRC